MVTQIIKSSFVSTQHKNNKHVIVTPPVRTKHIESSYEMTSLHDKYIIADYFVNNESRLLQLMKNKNLLCFLMTASKKVTSNFYNSKADELKHFAENIHNFTNEIDNLLYSNSNKDGVFLADFFVLYPAVPIEYTLKYIHNKPFADFFKKIMSEPYGSYLVTRIVQQKHAILKSIFTNSYNILYKLFKYYNGMSFLEKINFTQSLLNNNVTILEVHEKMMMFGLDSTSVCFLYFILEYYDNVHIEKNILSEFYNLFGIRQMFEDDEIRNRLLCYHNLRTIDNPLLMSEILITKNIFCDLLFNNTKGIYTKSEILQTFNKNTLIDLLCDAKDSFIIDFLKSLFQESEPFNPQDQP
jgi:hypothetical protein